MPTDLVRSRDEYALIRDIILARTMNERGDRGKRLPHAPMGLTAVYQQDGPWIVAWIVEIPGVVTQGATLEEARENLLDALALAFEVRREHAAGSQTDQLVIHREVFPVSRPA